MQNKILAGLQVMASSFNSYIRVQLSAEEWLTDSITRELETRAANHGEISRTVTREYIAQVRERYRAEVAAAREAMEVQISIYQRRIAEIDEAIRNMGRQALDDNFDDRIRRLQATMVYEVDASNISAIAREIERLTAENNQRLERQALEDERSDLRGKISAAREHFSEQQRILNDLRDEEVRLAEERVEIHTESLARQQTAFRASEEANSALHLEEVRVREEHLSRFLRAKLRMYEDSARNTRQIMAQNNFHILRDMESRLHDFFEVGRRSGEAFFGGFREGTGGMADYITGLLQRAAAANDFSAFSGSSDVARGLVQPAAAVNNFNISVEQDFNVPFPSPSRVADETAAVLSSIVRGIR